MPTPQVPEPRASGLPLALTLALLACTDKPATDDSPGDSPADSANPATVTLSGECPLETDFGGFLVSVETEASGVDGRVADGVVPINVLEELSAAGGCRLMRRNNPYCEPACDPGYACDFDGRCLPYPVNQDLGVVRITGLSADSEMEPVFPGNTYYDTSLPHPAFSGGELITLRMPEGVYGPATLHGVGVEPLEALDAEWVVVAGEDLLVRWTPPADSEARSEIRLRVNIDQHGASPGTLYCDLPDTGEATLPGALLASLVEAGVTGFPSGALIRRTVDQAPAGAGCMDLTVAYGVDVPVDVDGFTPCVGDADCPEGLQCNEELQICE